MSKSSFVLLVIAERIAHAVNYADVHLLNSIERRNTMKSYGCPKPPQKRLKRPSSYDLEPIYVGRKSWKSTRNTSWSWARDWWAQRGRAPVLIFRARTYTVSSERLWARVMRPAYGRE